MSLIAQHPIEFLLLLTASERTKKFSPHAGYSEFYNHLQELIDELALDHVAHIHARCAECEFDVGQYEEALSFIENVKSLQVPTHLSVGRVDKILGYICVKQGNLETGKRHIVEALANFEQNVANAQLEEMKKELLGLSETIPAFLSIGHELISLCDTIIQRMPA